jgi:putative ABC transport system substrate-binding protein
MRRRDFIVGMGGAAAWPIAVHAQQSERIRRVGILLGYAVGDDVSNARVGALQKALKELGWLEGQNIHFELRYAAAEAERRRTQTAEIVSANPDVIVANTAPVAAALLRATTAIPIVYAAGADPIVTGLATNLARPGGNFTGFSVTEPSLGGKWLELIRDFSPAAQRAAVVHDPSNPARAQYLQSIHASNAALKIELTQVDVSDGPQIANAIEAFAQGPSGALLVMPGAATGVHRRAIIETANRLRLPAIYPTRFYAEDGGLASYGGDYTDVFRRAASYVDRILRGEKAGDLPIQMPTKFEFVINLKTATSMGLTIPPTVLARADEVIE